MTGLVCTDCGVEAWTMGEDFYVNDGLWHLVMPSFKWESIICVGCFENRLGRTLVRTDFKKWFRFNRWCRDRTRFVNDPISPRLADRLKR